MSEESVPFEGAGFRIVGREELGSLEICRWPDRKSVSLNISQGSIVKPLAYFRDDECAKEFISWLHGSFTSLGALLK